MKTYWAGYREGYQQGRFDQQMDSDLEEPIEDELSPELTKGDYILASVVMVLIVSFFVYLDQTIEWVTELFA